MRLSSAGIRSSSWRVGSMGNSAREAGGGIHRMLTIEIYVLRAFTTFSIKFRESTGLHAVYPECYIRIHETR